jgi:hypothetical protein
MFKVYIPIALLLITLQYHALLIWSNDNNNQRPFVTFNFALMQAAQWKAEYLSTHKFAHCTEDGECPNKTITRFGCKHNYSINGNSVESLIKGVDDAGKAYRYLLGSEKHKIHLLATIDFFKEQTDLGVGYSQNIFVFLSAKCL